MKNRILNILIGMAFAAFIGFFATLGAQQVGAPVNIAQVNGITTLMGNGGTGTGSQRVTIASDNTAFTVNMGTGGTGATSLGKAEDAAHTSADTGVAIWGVRNEAATQFNAADGKYTPLAVDAYGAMYMRQDHPKRVHCTSGGPLAVSTATTLTVLNGCAAPGASLSIYITDVNFSTNAAGIAADSFNTIKYGTGGACGTGTNVIWAAFTAAAVQANTVQSLNTPIKIPANNEVCWINSTAGSKLVILEGFIAP